MRDFGSFQWPLPCGLCGGLLNISGGQMSHEKEKQQIGRDVKVEIHKGMDQESRASHESGELQRPDEGIVLLAQAPERLDDEREQKPGAT